MEEICLLIPFIFILPVALIASFVVKHSLEHGVCKESSMSFAALGMFRIVRGDRTGGRHMANIVRAIIKKHKALNEANITDSEIRANSFLHFGIDIWFESERSLSQKLLSYHERAMKIGQIDSAMIALYMGCRYHLHGGGNLLLYSHDFSDRLALLVRVLSCLFSNQNPVPY